MGLLDRILGKGKSSVSWTIDTSDAAFDEGDRAGILSDESRKAFAKIVPSKPPAKTDIDIIGRVRCRGCGHWNDFKQNFFGAMGSAGCGCSNCDCRMGLGLMDDDKKCVWVVARMVTISSPRYPLEMTIQGVEQRPGK